MIEVVSLFILKLFTALLIFIVLCLIGLFLTGHLSLSKFKVERKKDVIWYKPATWIKVDVSYLIKKDDEK